MDVAIFGAGDMGELAYKTLTEQGDNVRFFLDNSSSKWGRRTASGKIIFSLEQYIELRLTTHIVIATGYVSQYNIEKLLHNAGLTNYSIYDRAKIRGKGRLISYSHEKEMTDVILYHVLKDEEDIFYIDVGSNDPLFNSVTKLLYDMKNAHGINVEPQPYLAEYSRKERPRDLTLCMGVSNEEGTMDLYQQEGGSTFIEENVLLNNCPKISVPITTLDKICEEYVSDRIISFLKIDVEGFEKEVLQGVDLSKIRPRIIIVESFIPRKEERSYLNWENILLQNRYRFVFEYGLNRYYVADECEDQYDQAFEEAAYIENYYYIHRISTKFWK